ncbi:hypothetical protein [Enterovibrio calviensis]|uniref:hypothetical protein n=1 Tax=Enterovibrio calviensis TaxID=91359 RepID=UPI0004886F0D|nr:hypothetical protein [Enterovibrio calviensis]
MGALLTALSSAGSAIASGASAAGGAIASGASTVGGAIGAGASAIGLDTAAGAVMNGFTEGSVIAGSPEAIAASKEAAAVGLADPSVIGAQVVDAGKNLMPSYSYENAALELANGIGEFGGEAWKGVSSAVRGVGENGMYQNTWGESLGAMAAESLINMPASQTSQPTASASMGSYGGGARNDFDATGYLTRGFAENSPSSYISAFARRSRD